MIIFTALLPFGLGIVMLLFRVYILVVFIGAVCGQGYIAAQNINTVSNQPENTNSNLSTAYSEISPPSNYESSESQQTRIDWTKWSAIGTLISALCSGLLFILMIVQGGFIFRQLVQIKRQADLMEKSLTQTLRLFDLSERPALGVLDFQLETLPDGRGRVLISINNSGKSPARNVIIRHEGACYVATALKNCPEPDTVWKDKKSGAVVIPVGSQMIRYSSIKCKAEEIDNGIFVLFVWVHIKYTGLTGQEYFCETYAQYDPSVERFRACPTHNDAN